jgi:hypothetical protein
MTVAAKPGQREGGGALNCLAIDLVLMKRGATRAAAVATWALVRVQGDVLVGKVALRSRVARRFQMRSHLAESVVLLVDVTLLSTLGNDGCASMGRVILLLSSVWVAGTLGGVCTLGTCCILGVCTLGTLCVLGVLDGVATSSKRLGRASTWAFVASMIR